MRFVLDRGRRIALHRTATGGDGARAVVLCHGAPGAGNFDPDPAQTRTRNVTLISVDRPGYGGSDPVLAGEWATVSSAADDLATVLDGLQVERVGVAGWSAGGRVALALAARRPDLVDRVVVAGTPAADDEIPWIDPDERAELERLRQLAPKEANAALAERLAPLVPVDPASDDALWLLGAGPADGTALGVDGVRARLGEMLHAAFVQGAQGLAADIAGYCLQPWGFEPDTVLAKTLLLYGSRDAIAGPQHGRWWQSRLPDARLEVVPDAGHLLLVTMWSRVLSHLAPGYLRSVEGSGRRERRPSAGAEAPSAA